MNRLRTGGILLAAGVGRRFGSDKRRVRLHGGEMVFERSLRTLAAVCDETLLVLGARDDPRDFMEGLPPTVRVVNASRSAGGMGFSLADAMVHADAWDACLVGLADKPFVTADTVQTVRKLLLAHDLVVPTHGGLPGHPVGFRNCHFARLAALEGDAGARSLIRSLREQVHFVELDDPGILTDIDTPEQLERWQRDAAH